jgi:hypothetical protein
MPMCVRGSATWTQPTMRCREHPTRGNGPSSRAEADRNERSRLRRADGTHQRPGLRAARCRGCEAQRASVGRPRRPHQRIRAGGIEAQVRTGGRVLEPNRTLTFLARMVSSPCWLRYSVIVSVNSSGPPLSPLDPAAAVEGHHVEPVARSQRLEVLEVLLRVDLVRASALPRVLTA